MQIEVFGLTDTGRMRSGNEDSILVAPEFALGVVCDGMGGHEAGEVASKTAVDSIHAWFTGGGDDGAHYQLDQQVPPPGSSSHRRSLVRPKVAASGVPARAQVA